jgi:hypothetical protein
MAELTKLSSLTILCELMMVADDFDLVFDGGTTWEGDEVSVSLAEKNLLLVGEDESEVIGTFEEPVTGVMLNDCLAIVQHDAWTIQNVINELERYAVNDPEMYEKPLL